jgi:hypothetical protein
MGPHAQPLTLKKIALRTDKALPVSSGTRSDGEGIEAGVLPRLLIGPMHSMREAAEVMTASYATAN